MVCSFLALVLQEELRQRLASKRVKASWDDLVRDLAAVSETVIRQEGKRFAVRSRMSGPAVEVFRAAGLRIPPVIRQLDRAA